MSRWFCAFKVNFWAQREPKRENNACNLVAAGAPYNKQGTKDVKNQEAGCWPQLAEMHMKGMISVRPDSCIFLYIAAAATKSLQSCPTQCGPIDGSPPGSPVPGILQARTLEWVAISCSDAWKWKVKVKSLSHVWLFATPWTAAHQAPPSMGFSRQECWSGVPKC